MMNHEGMTPSQPPPPCSLARIIGGQTVHLVCAPGQEGMAQEILTSLERLAAQRPLAEGTRVRFGWSLLTVCAEGEGDRESGLLVCEPDFAGNPFTSVRPRVDITLDVLERQARLINRLGVTPVDVGFEQYVVVRRGALNEEWVRMLRASPTSEDDSGWSIVQAYQARRSEREEDYIAVQVYRLIELRPVLLAALTLPLGYAVSVRGNQINSILDENRQKRLNR